MTQAGATFFPDVSDNRHVMIQEVYLFLKQKREVKEADCYFLGLYSQVGFTRPETRTVLLWDRTPNSFNCQKAESKYPVDFISCARIPAFYCTV